MEASQQMKWKRERKEKKVGQRESRQTSLTHVETEKFNTVITVVENSLRPD